MAIELIAIGKAVLAAAAYSFLLYQRKNPGLNSDNFKPVKFGSTMVVGSLIGCAMALAGDPLSMASLEAELAGYGGMIVLVENVIRWAMKEFEERRKA